MPVHPRSQGLLCERGKRPKGPGNEVGAGASNREGAFDKTRENANLCSVLIVLNKVNVLGPVLKEGKNLKHSL